MLNSDSSSAYTSNPPPTTAARVTQLKDDVVSLRSQLSEVLSVVKSNATAPAAPPEPTTSGAAAAADIPTVHAEYQVGQLKFSLPAPASGSVAASIGVLQAYGETEKLKKFEKPRHLSPFPAKRFIPEPEGLFGRIKPSDIRDRWEAEVLWNIGYSQESDLAAAHKLSEALSSGDVSAATNHFSVLHHFPQACYERTQERIDFFADAIEFVKSEAILLQKYLCEDDHTFGSSLYRSTKSEFTKLRSQNFAKELNKQSAASSGRSSNNNHNNNNNNRHNKNRSNNRGQNNGNNGNARANNYRV